MYSDQTTPLTDPIDERLFGMLPSRDLNIAYLPSSPDPNRTWFRSQQDYYARFGVKLKFFGLESEYDPRRTSELLECDAIHMTGGNTFQFLYWLRARGLLSELQRYVSNGGVLIGVSAGAILMTPDIATSYLCGDEDYPGVTDLAGMKLVDFAFVPHFDGSDDSKRAASRHAATFGGPVYAVSDGGGVVVDGNQVEFIGPVWQVTPTCFEPILGIHLTQR